MRIRYVQKQLDVFEDYHKAKIRDVENLLRKKCHTYITEVTYSVEDEIRDQFRFLCSQLD